jgi:exodeoxyribonuclease VII small subunit
MPEEPSYREALAELEEILAAIEEEQVDVDELAVKIRRSSDLIRLCRSRIEAAEIAIEEIVAELDSGETNDG